MGYFVHHAIVVHGWNAPEVEAARLRCEEILQGELGPVYGDPATLVSPAVKSIANGHVSFFIAPDGSKEGWDCSDTMNRLRNKVCAYLRGTALHWVRVQFGGDEGAINARVFAHSADEEETE